MEACSCIQIYLSILTFQFQYRLCVTKRLKLLHDMQLLSPGGGGGVLTPNFGRYVPRQSEQLARAQERAPGRAWKWGAPERAWAVLSLKWGAPERAWSVFSMKMGHSGIARTRLANPRRWKWDSPELPGCVWLTRGAAFGLSRPWEAINGLKLKTLWKWWSPERQNPPKKCKMVMLRNGFFGNFWKWYAPERKFRAENGGISCGTYPICIHMEVPPPPPGLLSLEVWVSVVIIMKPTKSTQQVKLRWIACKVLCVAGEIIQHGNNIAKWSLAGWVDSPVQSLWWTWTRFPMNFAKFDGCH